MSSLDWGGCHITGNGPPSCSKDEPLGLEGPLLGSWYGTAQKGRYEHTPSPQMYVNNELLEIFRGFGLSFYTLLGYR